MGGGGPGWSGEAEDGFSLLDLRALARGGERTQGGGGSEGVRV